MTWRRLEDPGPAEDPRHREDCRRNPQTQNHTARRRHGGRRDADTGRGGEPRREAQRALWQKQQ